MRRAMSGLAMAGAVLVCGLAAAPAGAYVYFSSLPANTVARANLDGTGPSQNLITGTSSPTGVAVNGQYLYWSNGNGIGRSILDGTSPNQTLITGTSQPESVTVDAQHIYWANSGNGTIGRANLDGTSPNQNFITGANSPTGVVVDAQHIYWSNFGAGTIGRANIDGAVASVNQSLITGAASAGGVALDAHHVYWTHSIGLTGMIGRANLDGTSPNPAFIATVSDGARELAIDGQYLYWASLVAPGGVGRANLDGTGPNASFIPSAGSFGMAVDGGPAGVAAPSAPGLGFATQPLATLSVPQSLTITNSGHGTLTFPTARVTAANADDFLISSDSCSGVTLWPAGTCTIGLRFGPSAAGGRAATLNVPSNDPASPLAIALQGTGGALVEGPAGANGAPGSNGATGSAGAAGKVEVVTCTTTTKGKGKHRTTTTKCTAKLTSAPVKFTVKQAAVLARGSVVYATGWATKVGKHTQLVLTPRRTIRAGRYTLTLGHGKSRHHQTITIG